MAKVYWQHTIGKAVDTSTLNPFPLLIGMENEKAHKEGKLGISMSAPFDLATPLWESLLQIHLNLYKIIYL